MAAVKRTIFPGRVGLEVAKTPRCLGLRWCATEASTGRGILKPFLAIDQEKRSRMKREGRVRV